MDGGPRQSLWVVVALLERMPAGASFSRREWPAHVTLASNFVVVEPADEIARAVASAIRGVWPLRVRFGGQAMFGARHDVPVQLVESPEVVALHDRLADLLETFQGFAARDPRHWRRGYRPHMTHVPTLSVEAGDVRELRCIALAELVGSTATVAAAFDGSQPVSER
jgi:2'-5' RNA ligase